MVKVLAFDVDGVLTCHRCTPKRMEEQRAAVRHMIDHANRNGYRIAVNTARTYGTDGIMRATTLSGVQPDVTDELVRANGGDPFVVCYRPHGRKVAERKMECLSQLAGQLRTSADDKGHDQAILVEDNTENYSRAGSLLGQRGSVEAPEGDMYTAGVLVPRANGVTTESARDLLRAIESQSELARRVRAVVNTSFDLSVKL